MVTETQSAEIKEVLHPERIFLLSPVYQPKWYPGEIDPNKQEVFSDKIRGDFIIKNLKKANELGYSTVLIYDPKDNAQFLETINSIEPNGTNTIVIQKQSETTYSGARRDAIRLATMNSNCEVIVMLELEKPMIEHIPSMVQQILDDKLDGKSCLEKY